MNKTIIIAEAGVNHNGDINIAKKLIDAASYAGVDYIKFQTFKASKLVSNTAPKAIYQSVNTHNAAESQLAMLEKLELSENDHYELINYCEKKKIKFFSTAFDLTSLDFLHKLKLDLFKIPSGEITNLPYLEKIASISNKVILSTGMCTMQEIEDAVQVLLVNPNMQICILHCNTEYPTPFSDVNLLAMNTIADKFNVDIGYSDHTLGIEVPIAAVALGAKVIEKHFTLDRTLPGPDHVASLEPAELTAMVSAIRNIELALGSKNKQPSASEIKNIAVARKSIYLKNDVKEGQIIHQDDLEMLRPGNGISPMKMHEVIGKRATSSLKQGHQLSLKDLNI